MRKLIYIVALLFACQPPPPGNHAPIIINSVEFGEVHGNDDAASTLDVTLIPQYSQGTYIMGIGAGVAPASAPIDVSSVSGCGLTWNEEIQQDAGDGDFVRTWLYEAKGKPTSDNCTATVTLNKSAQVAAIVMAYEDVNGGIQDVDGNSESDTSADITLATSGAQQVFYITFVNTRTQTITGQDANYTSRLSQTGQANTKLYAQDSTSDPVYSATISGTIAHVEVGGYVRSRRIN